MIQNKCFDVDDVLKVHPQ